MPPLSLGFGPDEARDLVVWGGEPDRWRLPELISLFEMIWQIGGDGAPAPTFEHAPHLLAPCWRLYVTLRRMWTRAASTGHDPTR